MGGGWADMRLRGMDGKHGIWLAIRDRKLILEALGLGVGKGLGSQGTISNQSLV